jgi:hypothetical protein
MKTAYELAMERLSKSAPAVTLSKKQKAALAELDSKHAADLAAREIHLQGQAAKAIAEGDYTAAQEYESQLTRERREMAVKLEEKKEAVRLDVAR